MVPVIVPDDPGNQDTCTFAPPAFRLRRGEAQQFEQIAMAT